MRLAQARALSLGLLLMGPGAPALAQDKIPATAPAYYVADFAVTDRDGIKPYSAAVEGTFKPYGGRFIVRGADPVALEGQAPKGRLVVIRFDSMERAQAWYHSPAYDALKPVRQRSGISNIYIVQGLVP